MKKKEIKNVLYIHGFNSGPGKKAAIIKQNGFECFCPQLINQPKKDIETLKDCIKNNNIHHIVGTSLGGYYGSILSIEFKDLQYHLINMSYQPYETLKRFLNTTVKNYKNDEEFFVDTHFLNELESIKPTLSEMPLDNINFYFGTNDKVLNFEELLADLTLVKNEFNFFEEQQDHRFADIGSVILNIKRSYKPNVDIS